jgi:hypothetical protein
MDPIGDWTVSAWREGFVKWNELRFIQVHCQTIFV